MDKIAETNDTKAYLSSLPTDWARRPKPNSLMMMDGPRFDFRANQHYRMPSNEWDKIADNPDAMIKTIQWFMTDHYKYQVPRLLTLQRYYEADNDILYWHSNKAADRADNRIPSALPHFATDVRDGYQFGNPLTYGYTNPDDENDTGEDLLSLIWKFNAANDSEYHDKMMGKNIINTGRGYELVYVKPDTHDIALRLINPANAFIVYDTTLARHSLFAVRYYLVEFMDEKIFYADVYTNKRVYHYSVDGGDSSGEMSFINYEDHYFDDIPMTEFNLNDERIGGWERKLNTIDAIDKAISEMANSQEDFGNAILVVSGDVDVDDDVDPITDKDGNQLFDQHGEPIYRPLKIDPTKRMLFLKPSQITNANGTTVVPTDAKYLTKSLDPNGWKLYVDDLVNQFMTETNSPNTSDENFAGNASGVAMGYKLLGTDQERAILESLYTRGIMHRLKLLNNYWSFIDLTKPDITRNVVITFNPNLPKNDSETVANVQTLAGTGAFSKQTLREKAKTFTGVTAEQEAQRVKDEQDEAMQSGLAMLDSNNYLTDQQKGGGVDGTDKQAGATENNETD